MNWEEKVTASLDCKGALKTGGAEEVWRRLGREGRGHSDMAVTSSVLRL